MDGHVTRMPIANGLVLTMSCTVFCAYKFFNAAYMAVGDKALAPQVPSALRGLNG